MAPLACTCWSRRWHTHPFMERDSPILSHPQIVSLAFSGLLPTFTCFPLTDHTACPVDQEKYGECNKYTCFLLECLSSVQISFVTRVWTILLNRRFLLLLFNFSWIPCVSVLSSLLRWSSVFPKSWYACPCVTPCSWVLMGLTLTSNK